MRSYLLIVTTDGYGKRLPLESITLTRRGIHGAKVSSVPIAAAFEAEEDGEIVLSTSSRKVVRIPLATVAVRRRKALEGGRLTKGVRLVKLPKGETITAASLVQAADPSDDAQNGVQGVPNGLRGHNGGPADPWPLQGLSRASIIFNFHPLKNLDEIVPGGMPRIPRSEWSATPIHEESVYHCLHCRRQHPDPHAVYGCIDSHVRAPGAVTPSDALEGSSKAMALPSTRKGDRGRYARSGRHPRRRIDHLGPSHGPQVER